jgi:hypothetical protein
MEVLQQKRELANETVSKVRFITFIINLSSG